MGQKIKNPTPNTLKNLITRRLLAVLALAIGTGLIVIFTNLPSYQVRLITYKSRNTPPALSRTLPLARGGLGRGNVRTAMITNHPNLILNASLTNLTPYSNKLIISLPTSPSPSSPSPKPHPLPPTLAQWQDNTNSGDYFAQITPTQVGYLVWSQFPIRVYVETPTAINSQQAQAWVNSVLQAVQEWNAYLPLLVVEKPEFADISILRKAPPLQISPTDKIPRARSALTTYELYTNNKILLHRFTILLSPSQTGNYVIAAARHELGHALGIWGHSQLQTDALYFSQVCQPPPISVRDVNTLKRVYEQPTSLGWSL